ncbi:MAG: aminopeptidase N [Beijerinckiaceae bacterium]|nr:aminopeptidase N [Beijerinckiaceae bacterium]
MRTDGAKPVRLKDYRVPDYLIDKVDLDVKLHPSAARVLARLAIRPNPQGRPNSPLVLDGDSLTAARIALDGHGLDLNDTAAWNGILLPDGLTLHMPPQRPFILETETVIDASANTQLMGLFRSGPAYCTQCEAEGFRRITYFLDRPDVLSVYTVRIEADKSEAPLLLSNGNKIASGDIEGTGRHFAVWHDPFPKPCYLFALVGGDLGSIHNEFTTRSGRKVALGIHVEHGKEPYAAYAMDALKRAMKWDEEVYGREYDLNVFNIVAVSDFNMGAMENKGLNIFNDKYVLASPATATDTDFAHIEAVIAHEYFHNWTGNRITCRDWFQLCLKEGLTVFRDHAFSADMRSAPVRRIGDVRTLRAQQFAEDAGPLAHSVRPDTYMEINNFYTATIYEKGAELIRMLKVLIGDDAFRRGMDLYFGRHDGMAATIEEFISCFAEISGRDLTEFSRWYLQAGTPIVEAAASYDAAAKTFTVDFSQSCKPTPGQEKKEPFVIPIALGLVVPGLGDLPLRTSGNDGASTAELASGVIELAAARRRVVFCDVPSRPVPSLLRGFSAPVRLDYAASEAELITLISHDSDGFNRWQAAQTYATRLLQRSVNRIRAGDVPEADKDFIAALAAVIEKSPDPAFAAQAITLPSEADVAREIGEDVDPDAINLAREALRQDMGRDLKDLLTAAYMRLADNGPYSPDAPSAGRRALRNCALDLFAAGDKINGARLARQQFETAQTMTDKFAALGVLAQIPGGEREAVLGEFYLAYESEPLVIDKWFALQAMISERGTLERVKALMKHKSFAFTNPNRMRALVGSFAAMNPTRFNADDGSGYAFIANMVLEIDARNPQVAARLLSSFKTWRMLEPNRRELAGAALRRVAGAAALSPDVKDIAERSLA